MRLLDEILDEWPALFHDVRHETVDPEAHATFVIARVLDHGTVRSVRALLRHYGRERIRGFFLQGGPIASPRVRWRCGRLSSGWRQTSATDILTTSQLAVLDDLIRIPAVREFYLAGGTALALRARLVTLDRNIPALVPSGFDRQNVVAVISERART